MKVLEDRTLELMLEADDLAAAVKGAELDLAGEQKTVDGDRRTLAAELDDLKIALTRLATERSQLVTQVDPRSLAIFDLVSRRRNGVALAEARGGICMICHVRLRPQVFNEVRRNDQIIQCDSCNRILYFTSAPVPAAETASQPSQ